MRIVQKVALICFLLMSSGSTFAQNDYIVKHDNGEVNWNDLTIIAHGVGHFNPNLTPAQFQLSGPRTARLDAEKNLLSTLLELRYSSEYTVSDLLSESVETANRIEQLMQHYRILTKTDIMTDSSVEIVIELPLVGELFDELSQVAEQGNSIDMRSSGLFANTIMLADPIYFDCRGMNLKPALAPRIFGENGEALYSIHTVKQSVLQRGPIVTYLSAKSNSINPETIPAVKPIKVNICDLIIDDTAYGKLMSSEVSIKALNNGQVIILID